MKRVFSLLVLLAIVSASTVLWAAEDTAKGEVRPIRLADALAWKSIRSTVVSNDGGWFAYRLIPVEGDSTVVVRQTHGDVSYSFPAGETTRGQIDFSDDGKWLAFSMHPTREESRKAKSSKEKLENKVALVDLETGEKTVIDKMQRFEFSGRNPDWIALHRYPSGNAKNEQENPVGSDLVLRELETGREYNIGNVSEFAFDKYGRLLAWTIAAADKIGNGIQLRDLKRGTVAVLDSDTARYERLTWTEEGDGLTVLKGTEHKEYEEPLYSLLGFKDLTSDQLSKTEFIPAEDDSFPEGMTISPKRDPLWTDDLRGILFGIHEAKKKKDSDGKRNGGSSTRESDSGNDSSDDLPGLVIWHWKDKRLQARQQVQEQRDKNFSYLSIFRPDGQTYIRLADDEIKEVTAAPKHRWAIGFDDREYQLLGNLDGRRYRDIYVIDLETGERKKAVSRCRWYFGPSPEGTHFLYYDDGHFHTYEMATGTSFNITRDAPTRFFDEEDDHNVVEPPVRPIGWIKGGAAVLLRDNWDIWKVPVHGGDYSRRFQLDPEEKGIDLSVPVFFSAYGEWAKKAGFARLDPDESSTRILLWDDASYYNLLKARDADVYLYTRETYKDYPDYYVTDSTLGSGKRITDANPQQQEYLWSEGSRLIDYESRQGKRLQAALFLPAGYEEGKSYPTIVYIYERLSQALNRYFSPNNFGFNKSVYTSNGYAVLMPDITYTVDDPGMSAVWCVLPALEAAVKTGIVDPDHVGIHGHSWGGYQTSFLVTQTDSFQAAIAGAPLTNMISMYSSVYWNTGSPNQPIFESSQGRFKGGYWENLEAYTRNSPVFFAEQVTTPLIILHNDKDGAVDWNQGIEYFNTLRRLQKPVVMLQYGRRPLPGSKRASPT